MAEKLAHRPQWKYPKNPVNLLVGIFYSTITTIVIFFTLFLSNFVGLCSIYHHWALIANNDVLHLRVLNLDLAGFFTDLCCPLLAIHQTGSHSLCCKKNIACLYPSLPWVILKLFKHLYKGQVFNYLKSWTRKKQKHTQHIGKILILWLCSHQSSPCNLKSCLSATRFCASVEIIWLLWFPMIQWLKVELWMFIMQADALGVNFLPAEKQNWEVDFSMWSSDFTEERQTVIYSDLSEWKWLSYNTHTCAEGSVKEVVWHFSVLMQLQCLLTHMKIVL